MHCINKDISTSVCLFVCVCVHIGACQCPLNNNRQGETSLIYQHVANKKEIMNHHVQLRALKIEHLSEDI